MRRLVIAIAALAAFGMWSAATAALPSGIIVIGAGSTLAFDGAVTFDTTVTGKLKGYQYPMVYLACYQDLNGDSVIDTGFYTGEIVYGQLDHPDTVFILGGGSSPWRNTYGGGPAECVARLMIYGDRDDGGEQYVIASVAFSAGG